MADIYTPSKRSAIMSRVRAKDTKPELAVRRLLHNLGYRFRLHRTDLPGTPDIVLPRFRAVILVHGCFWHGHEGCKKSALPTSNEAFWSGKIGQNIARDRDQMSSLTAAGWRVISVWQCEIRDLDRLSLRLRSFLDSV
ncbi:MAG: very short patch repair endonuclease [Capsulimonadaceae bacterium]